MSAPASPLQVYIRLFYDAVHDSRDVLADDAYRVLLKIVIARLLAEERRILAGDLERTRRAA